MTYRVELRNAIGWRERNTAVLGVSVTSPNWQDDKFAAILSFAAARFDRVKIDVTDALYRHTIPEAQANALGALWLARHADIIAATPKAETVRWAQWHAHKDYAATLAGFERAHSINPALRDAVAQDVADFHRRSGTPHTLQSAEASKRFIIEEMAVLTLQARQWQGVRLYPGSQMHSFVLLRNDMVPEAPKGLEQEIYARVQLRHKGVDLKFGN